MRSDSFVVGLDLKTGAEAYIGDRPIADWRAKSYLRGDESLICLHCYNGIDAPSGTVVPLVVRYREGGFRRAHFAHPPGRAPQYGHSPETVWHTEGKHVLARWAQGQSNVVNAIAERYTPDGSRRADVAVTLQNGSQVALELQHRLETDSDWLQRHTDYGHSGIADVWLWHPQCHTPWIIAKHRSLIWYFDLPRLRLGVLVGEPHQRHPSWFRQEDLRVFARHVPPCVRDKCLYYTWPLDELKLGADGIQLPQTFTASLDYDQRAAVRAAAQAAAEESQRNREAEQEPQPSRRSPTLPILRTQQAKPSYDASPPDGFKTPAAPPDAHRQTGQSPARCDLCGIRLDPIIAHLGRHIDCEQQRLKRLGQF